MIFSKIISKKSIKLWSILSFQNLKNTKRKINTINEKYIQLETRADFLTIFRNLVGEKLKFFDSINMV